MINLVSVHMPKSGGISVRKILQEHYRDQLLLDYQDRPLHDSPAVRHLKLEFARAITAVSVRTTKGRYSCVHGHFMPRKYHSLAGDKNVSFITWLRDPADRLASHYYFWKRNVNPPSASTLHWRVLEEDWSLERFCLSPELRNVYQQFLWRFELDRFDFIGITEHFESELRFFVREFFGESLDQIPEENVNPADKVDYYADHAGLREKVIQFHSEDYDIYRRALNKREQRMRGAMYP